MTTSASSFPAAIPESNAAVRPRILGRAEQDGSLAMLAPGRDARVTAVLLESDQATWLAAVGIRAGERLTVLRHAAFGGPIHVRTRAGGEFALARSLARAILVKNQP